MKIRKVQIRELGWKTITIDEMLLETAAKTMYDALESSTMAQVGRVLTMVGIGTWRVEFESNKDGQYIGLE